MLEDSVVVMEKKGVSRQLSNSAKPNAAIERKNDSSSTARYHGRYSRRRDNGSGRGTPSDFSSRKPLPQKARTALDKRPRQRGSFGGRQREEIAETEEAEAESSNQQWRPRKGDGSYLLNFTFADRKNVPTHRQHRPRYWKKNFSKEQYLQANCQFVVKDSGDYTVQACDPDALVDWDLVEQVRTFSFGQTACPICLHPPAAGQITKCGHVYCWACILHYLGLDAKNSSRCPICFDDVKKSDLRSVKVVEKQEHKLGEVITLRLMKRARDSTYAVPCTHWEEHRQGQPQHIHDPLNTEFAKVLVASAAEIQTTVIEEERQALLAQLAAAEDSEVCFIESALVLLSEKEVSLQGKTQASQDNRALMDTLSNANSNDSTNNRERANNGNRDNNNGSGNKTPAAGSTPPPPPVVAKPLPRNVSFDGSKIRKQYADAFEELEEEAEEEEENVVSWGDLSDHEDTASTDSLMSLSSPSSLSLPVVIPGAAHCSAPSSEGSEEPRSVPSDDGLFAIPAETGEAEDAMTTEEAVEQLAMPVEGDSTAGGNGGNITTPKRGEGNQSKRYFYFYQASDGQQIYLHSINARCICREYGSLEHGPTSITATIVDKEVTFMNDDIRKRVRYLSHIPKACEFQIVEVQLQPPTVSHNTLRHFLGELKRRAQYRQKVRRDDRRMARKQHIQEKMSYGIYPEVKLALDSPDQFPAPPSAEGSERRRNSSLTDMAAIASSSATTGLSASPELNANAQEFVPAAKSEPDPPNSAPCAFSFAAALKKAKQPAPPCAWGASNAGGAPKSVASAAAAGPVPSRRADSGESDNEDRVPVPQFKNSFSDAISAKLETLVSKEGDQANGKGGKKKKKKEKKLLFSTDMMRR